jgi:hypothetical protein
MIDREIMEERGRKKKKDTEVRLNWASVGILFWEGAEDEKRKEGSPVASGRSREEEDKKRVCKE